ncbi:hypothetical protein EJ03DRAFT_338313 [Teratosphaeria nubilosa]|uniref:Uncharacterized protein n=1 Tax=Teratosphaeria nubilosa TaxID=161662 RepID=A0A6G1L1R6_9PEZI|nr:hypothetical protein EJ03DRAFT_338313 [Teratosphaeria nubilosa]
MALPQQYHHTNGTAPSSAQVPNTQAPADYPVQHMNGYGIQQPVAAPHLQHFPPQQVMGGYYGMHRAGGAPPQYAPAHQVNVPARQEIIEIPNDDEGEVQVVEERSTPQTHQAAAPAPQHRGEWEGFSMRRLNRLVAPHNRAELNDQDRAILRQHDETAKSVAQRANARKAEEAAREKQRKAQEGKAAKAELEKQGKEKKQREREARNAADQRRRQMGAAGHPPAGRAGGLMLPNMRPQPGNGAPTASQPDVQQSQPQAQQQQNPAPAPCRPAKEWTPTCAAVQAVRALRVGQNNASMGIVFQGVPNIMAAMNNLGLRSGLARMRLTFSRGDAGSTFRLELAGALQNRNGSWTHENLYHAFGFANADNQDYWPLPHFTAIPRGQPVGQEVWEPFQTTSGGIGFTSRVSCEAINGTIDTYQLLMGSANMRFTVLPNQEFTVCIMGHVGTRALPHTFNAYRLHILQKAASLGLALALVDDHAAAPGTVNQQQVGPSDHTRRADLQSNAQPTPAAASRTPAGSGVESQRADRSLCEAATNDAHAQRTRLQSDKTALAENAPSSSAPAPSAEAASKRKRSDESEKVQPITKRSRVGHGASKTYGVAERNYDSGYDSIAHSPAVRVTHTVSKERSTTHSAAESNQPTGTALQSDIDKPEDHDDPAAQSQDALDEQAGEPNGQQSLTDADDNLEALLQTAFDEQAEEPNGEQTQVTADDDLEAQSKAAPEEEAEEPNGEQSEVNADDNVTNDIDYEELFGSSEGNEQYELDEANHKDASPVAPGNDANDTNTIGQAAEPASETSPHVEKPTTSDAKNSVDDTEKSNSDSEAEDESDSNDDDEDDQETAAAKKQYLTEIAALEVAIEEKRQSMARTTNRLWSNLCKAKIEQLEKEIALKQAAPAALSPPRPEEEYRRSISRTFWVYQHSPTDDTEKFVTEDIATEDIEAQDIETEIENIRTKDIEIENIEIGLAQNLLLMKNRR